MPEKPEKTQAEIPYSMLEYTAAFKHPILEATAVPAILIAEVLRSLEPWGFKLDGVRAKTAEKLDEYAITFQRGLDLAPDRTVVLGLSKVSFTAQKLEWQETEEFVALVGAGLSAIRQAGRAEIESQSVTVAMHVQLKTKPRRNVTAPLLSPQAFELLNEEVNFPGILLYGEKASITIDASAGLANGLFVRIVRHHLADATLEEMAGALLKDEEQLFGVLGLEGVL